MRQLTNAGIGQRTGSLKSVSNAVARNRLVPSGNFYSAQRGRLHDAYAAKEASAAAEEAWYYVYPSLPRTARVRLRVQLPTAVSENEPSETDGTVWPE